MSRFVSVVLCATCLTLSTSCAPARQAEVAPATPPPVEASAPTPTPQHAEAPAKTPVEACESVSDPGGDARSISKALMLSSRSFQSCYDQYLRRNMKKGRRYFSGKIVVNFKMNFVESCAIHRAESSKAYSNHFHEDEFLDCMEHATDSITGIYGVKTRGQITVNKSFVFSTDNGCDSICIDPLPGLDMPSGAIRGAMMSAVSLCYADHVKKLGQDAWMGELHVSRDSTGQDFVLSGDAAQEDIVACIQAKMHEKGDVWDAWSSDHVESFDVHFNTKKYSHRKDKSAAR